VFANLTLCYFYVNGGSKTISLQQFLTFIQKWLDFFCQITLFDFLPFFGLIEPCYPQIDILQVACQITSSYNMEQCQAVNTFAVCSRLRRKL